MNFCLLLKKMGKRFGKNISKNLSGKYSQKLDHEQVDHAKQSLTDTLETTSKR